MSVPHPGAWQRDVPGDRHPTAVVGHGVVLGPGCVLGAYAVLLAPLAVGAGCWIGPHAVLGTSGESRGAAHGSSDEAAGLGVQVGDDCVLREMVTVHGGRASVTTIGRACYVMNRAHLGHDVQLGDEVTVAAGVLTGGHTWVGRRANLGLGVITHQRSVIGAGAMVAMGAVVKRPIPPYAVAAGSPARVSGVNQRWVPDDELAAMLRAYYGGEPLPAECPPDVAADIAEYEERLALSS